MIPKVIHYCWFGRNPLPKSALKCIASWRRFFPEYEIKEWNEDNFDVNVIPYTQQAYTARKYAFVSDYARFWILYRYGGLYFDSDVEIIKPMDDIVESGPFMGIEVPAIEGLMPQVNPGLGFGISPGLGLCRILLEKYESLSFHNADGSYNQITIVTHTTEVLIDHGLQSTNDVQQVAGIWVYPQDYFNPLDSLTGRVTLTDNTRSIHWYMNSWNNQTKLYRWLSRLSHRLFSKHLHRIKETLLSYIKR